MDEFGSGFCRIFLPYFSSRHQYVPESQLIVYNPAKQVSQFQFLHPRTNTLELDELTLVLWIDGACRDNGKPSARASWGVYFGPGSRYNARGRLPPEFSQTSFRAEIEALSQALDIVRGITDGDMRLQEVRILSDSNQIVNAMTIFMQNWILNGGRTVMGHPVAHFHRLEEIHDRLDDMTYGDNGGLDFKFFHICRAKNRDADALANQALDE